MSRAAPAPFPDLDADAHVAFLRAALDEDRVDADVTIAALRIGSRPVAADLWMKAPGVVCGLPLVQPLFRLLDPRARVEAEAADGDRLGAGTRVLTLHAGASAVLRGERVALNLLQRLSGVATRTAEFVERTVGTAATICDTRKTTPGWRVLEKYAVRCGGGRNHRMDLADAAMLKENHLVAKHGRTGPEALGEAVRALRERLDPGLALYVEVENQAELQAAVAAAGPGRGELVVMLDDFELGDVRRAVEWVRSRPPPHPVLEVTGGVTLERVEALAATGVQRLSTGALTHSAVALDMSLKIRSGAAGG